MPSLTLQKLQDLRALTTVSTPATVFALRMKRHAKPELRCSLESADEDTRYVVPEADLCSRACSLVAPACSSRLAGDRDPSVLGLNLLDNLREPVFHFSKGQLLKGTSPNGRDLHTLDKYCVPAPHDTQSRKRGKAAGTTERYTGHRVERGPVTSTAKSIAEERHDASGVGARGVQGREGGSPTHYVQVSRESTAVDNRPCARDPVWDRGDGS